MDVINMPSDEIYIFELVQMIVEEVGYKGKILWDTSKSDGQVRKMLDTERNNKLRNFEMKWSLKDGIKETIQGYKDKWLI
jgi:GDP-L-fucose synthase